MVYEAVLFDAAETLFTTRGSVGEIYASVAEEFSSRASASEIQAAFTRHFRSSGPVSRQSEKEWWRNIVHRVFSDVGMVADFDRFFDKVYDQFRDARGWYLFPETREVLEGFRLKSLKIGIISNFDSRLYTVMKDLEIETFFDSVTISSETGYAKPDPEIFHSAVRALGVQPSQILFAGDSLVDDYQGAERIGIMSFLLDRSGRYSEMRSVRRISNLRELLAIVP